MPKKHGRPSPGDVAAIALPDGRYAFGRVYRDGTIGIYEHLGSSIQDMPVGSGRYRFHVRVYDASLRHLPVIAHDPFVSPEHAWPPPMSVKDPITGSFQIYERGSMRPATPSEAQGLEPAAAWTIEHIVARLIEVAP